jgi:TctA family transporter
MSFLTLYSVGKTRTGVAVLIKEVSINFSYKIIILILISVLISGIFSFFITLFISRKICNRIDKYNYQSISLIVLITIIAINFIVGRVTNILILIPCALIGLYSNKLNARKSNMMYCLLTPTIWFYLTNN